jgi:hypothetical protein
MQYLLAVSARDIVWLNARSSSILEGEDGSFRLHRKAVDSDRLRIFSIIRLMRTPVGPTVTSIAVAIRLGTYGSWPLSLELPPTLSG